MKDPASGSGVNGLQGAGQGSLEIRKKPGIVLQTEETPSSRAGGNGRMEEPSDLGLRNSGTWW